MFLKQYLVGGIRFIVSPEELLSGHRQASSVPVSCRTVEIEFPGVTTRPQQML